MERTIRNEGLRRIEYLARLHPDRILIGGVYANVGGCNVPVMIARGVRQRGRILAWAIHGGSMYLDWDDTPSAAYKLLVDRLGAGPPGRRCGSCENFVDHAVPQTIAGEFYCSLRCGEGINPEPMPAGRRADKKRGPGKRQLPKPLTFYLTIRSKEQTI